MATTSSLTSPNIAPAPAAGLFAENAPLCDCAAHEGTALKPARHWQEVAFLLLLWLLHCAGNLWWLKTDTRPPYSDMAGHAITTLRMASWAWLHLLVDGSFVQTLLNVNPYPPLFYVTTLPLVWVVGHSVDVMLVVNMLYLGLLIFSTYGIGRLAVSGRAGLLAAFLVSMYPLIYGLSREYLADVALTAVTSFAIFCLFWSRAFERRWPSLIVGVMIGLGMLTKWTFIVFMAGPLVIAVYLTLRHATRGRVINLVLAGVLALVIGLPWYINNLGTLREFLEFNSTVAPSKEGEAAIWTLASWGYYLRELLTQQLLLPFSLLFVVGAVLAFRRCRINGYLWMLLSWIVVGYIVSTLFINKDTRYTMPYLPALALITAIGLVQIRQVMVKRVGLALLILYALVQYVGLTVGLNDKVAGMAALPAALYTESVHVASPARAENWQLDPILAALLADAKARGLDVTIQKPAHLVVMPSMPSFDPRTFAYAQWRDRLPIDVLLVTGIVDRDSVRALQQSHYVVTKTGNLGWEFVLQDAGDLTTQLLDPNSTLSVQFEVVAEFPLPDGSKALLFRHIGSESD